MSGTITRAAYQQLVDEDICWLERQPRTLERDHVIDIVRHSVEVYYGELRDLRDQVAQLTLERDREAALADHQAKGVETFSNQLAAANSEVERLRKRDQQWQEEAFISLAHCEAVGADKAAAVMRTLLLRMGIEEPSDAK